MYEHLVIIFRVTEYKNGQIYKTKKIGPAWKALNETTPEGELWVSPNQKEIEQHGGDPIRKISWN